LSLPTFLHSLPSSKFNTKFTSSMRCPRVNFSSMPCSYPGEGGGCVCLYLCGPAQR
jgi:hypothetical protein